MGAWYRWPENRNTGLVPWFVIFRRLIAWPFLLSGLSITFVAVIAGFGLKDAKRMWRNFR